MKIKGFIKRIGVGKVYLTEGSDTESYCPIWIEGEKDYIRVIITSTMTLDLWSLSAVGDHVEFEINERKELLSFKNHMLDWFKQSAQGN